MPKWVYDMWVILELSLPTKIIRMFGPKTAIFAPKYAFLGMLGLAGSFGALLAGWLVGVLRSAQAVSHKTPIYFI